MAKEKLAKGFGSRWLVLGDHRAVSQKLVRGSADACYTTAIKVTTFQPLSRCLSPELASGGIICLKIVRSSLRPLIKQKPLTFCELCLWLLAQLSLASLVANLKAHC